MTKTFQVPIAPHSACSLSRYAHRPNHLLRTWGRLATDRTARRRVSLLRLQKCVPTVEELGCGFEYFHHHWSQSCGYLLVQSCCVDDQECQSAMYMSGRSIRSTSVGVSTTSAARVDILRVGSHSKYGFGELRVKPIEPQSDLYQNSDGKTKITG